MTVTFDRFDSIRFERVLVALLLCIVLKFVVLPFLLRKGQEGNLK